MASCGYSNMKIVIGLLLLAVATHQQHGVPPVVTGSTEGPPPRQSVQPIVVDHKEPAPQPASVQPQTVHAEDPVTVIQEPQLNHSLLLSQFNQSNQLKLPLQPTQRVRWVT